MFPMSPHLFERVWTCMAISPSNGPQGCNQYQVTNMNKTAQPNIYDARWTYKISVLWFVTSLLSRDIIRIADAFTKCTSTYVHGLSSTGWFPLERVREKPESVTHQPNQSLNLDGDRDVPECLFGKKKLSFETLFRSRPPQPKKKRAFCSFFFETWSCVTSLWPSGRVCDPCLRTHVNTRDGFMCVIKARDHSN
jgi:hypothetical protein